jgi:hypothetical protein
MASSGILRRVTLVRTDVSEELSDSFIRVTSIGELETTLAVTNNRRTLRRNTKHLVARVVPISPILVTLMKEALSSSDTSVLTRSTRRNIPEDAILHSHRRENLKSYKTKNCRSLGNFTEFVGRFLILKESVFCLCVALINKATASTL